MTADEAIKAHREWKNRFLVAMAEQRQMNEAEISADCNCKFGQWLHGEAKQSFGHLTSYGQCVDTHAEFHREAGKVAGQVNTGDIRAANEMLGYSTPYSKISETLTISVIAMFKAGEAEGTAEGAAEGS